MEAVADCRPCQPDEASREPGRCCYRHYRGPPDVCRRPRRTDLHHAVGHEAGVPQLRLHRRRAAGLVRYRAPCGGHSRRAAARWRAVARPRGLRTASPQDRRPRSVRRRRDPERLLPRDRGTVALPDRGQPSGHLRRDPTLRQRRRCEESGWAARPGDAGARGLHGNERPAAGEGSPRRSPRRRGWPRPSPGSCRSMSGDRSAARWSARRWPWPTRPACGPRT